jgi:PD-(D/E)XK nuclease superfamily
MPDITEHLYLSSNYKSREELEKAVEANWDATTASQIARCPRNGEYSIRYGLRPKGEANYLRAGAAIHAGLSYFYAGVNPDLCLAEMLKLFPESNATGKFSHLTAGALEVVFKNYMSYAKRADNFKPLEVQMEDLNLSKVLGAVFRIAPNGNVILGESKIIMDFSDIVGKPFVYSGKPDLPVLQGGDIYLWDHKTTSSYLSTWYFDQYRFSNQLRGYCLMIDRMTDLRLNGALINGIYVGERAVLSEFKGDRFGRYGPMLYSPGQLTEAIKNQYAWRRALDYYESEGYYPQHASKLCAGCAYDKLCALTPAIREASMRTEYEVVDRQFLDL